MWRFELWRWLLFVGGTVPLYGISKLVVHLLVVICESYPPARGAIYYVIGIKACILLISCMASKQQQGLLTSLATCRGGFSAPFA